ncbi:phage tail tube protein [Paenirhodobacter sp. CAU 1674]|uniref:phage tail tube protein n=1 Tax=Paenirhodobacter sp. CAU 1674 TaxID=3032596 RepID=UPI0023DBB4B0|nr:phage tail tube protein [Paenirhodobacter sp. CAU 1674]MDF2141249.1 phage tail tube protein [Paenirhodobacter sp. CAU 1674]
MTNRRWPTLAMLHKIEATYGIDAAPAAADALIATNITFTPYEATAISRDLMLPYMGHQGEIMTAEYGKIEFDIEIAGAGAAGTVPKYGSILRSCGFAETITAATKVEYSIVESAQESGSIYFNSDGVQHVFVGGRGNLSMNLIPKQIPKFRVSYMGMLGTVTDAALPAVSMAGLITPVPVSKANTTLSLHGYTGPAESLSIDLGNTVTPRFLIGEEEMKITDRKTTGTAVLVATSIATQNWFAVAQARTRGALQAVHGTVAGNIVEISGPAVEIGKPSQGQTDNIVNYSLPLAFCPVTGRDELLIAVR